MSKRRRSRSVDSPTIKPGMEELPLDLARVPTVEQGLADAADRYKGLQELGAESLGSDDDKVLLVQHLGFMSFINRASSLHAGIVDAVKAANPHAAFTLLRAYLELVVTIYYIDAHPDYIKALQQPMSELPPNTRKRFSDLFDFAGHELVGANKTYEVLNEMGHFGATALWNPFTVTGERGLSFSTGPRWRNPDDARTALAMLQESDESVAEVLRRYAAHHLTPGVERYAEHQRFVRSLATIGATQLNDERAFTLPPDIREAALEAGLLVHCEEHDATEIADGVTAEMIAAFGRERLGEPQQEEPSGETGDLVP